jgi:hypothetical protein
MVPWDERPSEVATLLNPAFCGEILRSSIAAYSKITSEGMPFSLLYLVLPIVLHSKTRSMIAVQNRQLHIWLKDHPVLKIGFAERARDLVPITREAVMFMLQFNTLSFDNTGNLRAQTSRPRTQLSQSIGSAEVSACYRTAGVVGRWFARAGTPATVYAMWGIRP